MISVASPAKRKEEFSMTVTTLKTKVARIFRHREIRS